METLEMIRTSLQQGEWITPIDFKDLLPCTNTGTVQKISEISYPGPVIPVQSSTIRTVHSILGMYNDCQRDQTDGLTQGYKETTRT